MKYSLAVAVLIGAGLVLHSGAPVNAQLLSAPSLRSEATMQDLENEALRNVVTRRQAGADTVSGGASYGNVFQASQTGQSNTIDAIQIGQYNTVDAVQSGTSNFMQIVQVGQSNAAVLAQSGSNNRITLRQGR